MSRTQTAPTPRPRGPERARGAWGAPAPTQRRGGEGPVVPAERSSHLHYAEEVPRQQRGALLVATEPQDCAVRAVFADGYSAQVAAVATAWREGAVHVVFTHPDPSAPRRAGLYRVWAPASRVSPVLATHR